MVAWYGTALDKFGAIDAAEVFVLGKGILHAELHHPVPALIEAPPFPECKLLDRLDLAGALKQLVVNWADILIIEVAAVPIALAALGQVIPVCLLPAVIPIELQLAQWLPGQASEQMHRRDRMDGARFILGDVGQLAGAIAPDAVAVQAGSHDIKLFRNYRDVDAAAYGLARSTRVIEGSTTGRQQA